VISQQATERGYQLLSGRKPELIGEETKAAMPSDMD